jgi:hypothetical protein
MMRLLTQAFSAMDPERQPKSLEAEAIDTARQRAAAMLAKRGELDAREAKFRQLAAIYGGNRLARRRARAELRKARQ